MGGGGRRAWCPLEPVGEEPSSLFQLLVTQTPLGWWQLYPNFHLAFSLRLHIIFPLSAPVSASPVPLFIRTRGPLDEGTSYPSITSLDGLQRLSPDEVAELGYRVPVGVQSSTPSRANPGNPCPLQTHSRHMAQDALKGRGECQVL